MKIIITIIFVFISLLGFGQSFSGSHSFSKPTLSPINVYALGETQAYIESYVNKNGGAEIIGYRILFDDNNPPVDTLLYSPTFNMIVSWTPLAIWDSKTGLTPGTTYYTKVCATNIAGETCTNVASITMPVTANNAPSVSTLAATSVSTTSATINGNVSSDGGATVTERGFYYSMTNPPNTNITSGTGTGTFNTPLSGLNTAQTYYFRAYATNSVGTSYGDVFTFTLQTPSGNPSLTTTIASNVTINSAVSGGEVLHDGGSAILGRGVCYSTSSSVDTTDLKIIAGGTIGVFGVYIPNLNANTTYYYRAYAYNANGVDYGTEYNFTTPNNTSVPTVTTTLVTNIATNSATLGGNATSDGGSAILEKGVCYGTSPNPTTGSPGGTGTGTFTVNISYLTPGITYYYRAYARNINGTSYGNEYQFTTLIPSSVPVVSTLEALNITTTTAIAGGSISYNGNSGITESGICYSTSSTPTIANSKVTSISTSGGFYAMLTPLLPSTTYYYRAYAINGIGTGYGSVMSFTTESSISLPTVTVSDINSIGVTVATGGGNVTDDGGTTVTVKGIVVNRMGNPSLLSYDFVTNDGSGEGSFTTYLNNLSCGTKYYVRAYATNSLGTAYSSEQKEFTTSTPSGTQYKFYYIVTLSDGAVKYTNTATGISDIRSWGNSLGSPPAVHTYGYTYYSIDGTLSVGKQLYSNGCTKTTVTNYFYYAPIGLGYNQNNIPINYPYPIYIIHVSNGIIDYIQEWFPD